ncbi:MAG: hypothetical protein WBP93_14930, partial [Pyrinomonadaceae bacterium]
MGIEESGVQRGETAALLLNEILPNHVVQTDESRRRVEAQEQGEAIELVAKLLGVELVKPSGRAPELLKCRERNVGVFGEDSQLAVA